MLPSVHTRAQHALFRCRRYRRLTVHEVADYGALLDLASRPHHHHVEWARMCGYDPDQVGTVVATNRVALSEQLGLGRNSETLGKRLERYEALGLADDRQGLIVLRPNGLVRIDDHRAAYETDAALADGQPWPAVVLPRRRMAAEAGEGVGDLVVPGEIVPRSTDRGTIPLPYKGDDAGASERAREPDPLDELATLLEDAAMPLGDGVPFRLSRSARRRLGLIVDEHGIDAVRSVLVDVAPNYAIRHPLAWLDATLSPSPSSPEPEPDPGGQPPEQVVGAVRACIAPGRGGEARALSRAELTSLAGLVERHGAEAVIAQATADDGVGGYGLPVQGIAARLDRKGQARSAARGRAGGRRPDSWAKVGRRVAPAEEPLTPEQERAKRDADARWAAEAAAERAAWAAEQARRAREEAAASEAARRAAEDDRARREAAAREAAARRLPLLLQAVGS